MKIASYLAMTAAEFQSAEQYPPHMAWMACHFSPYGTGLSNLPTFLPDNSLLILNDITPVFGHDPQRITEELRCVAEEWNCDGILLDFQRPGEAQTRAITEAIAALPFPVGVTPQYAEHLSCAVFLPPLPLTTPLQDYLAPWSGRDIWLEIATERDCIRVDRSGSHELRQDFIPIPLPHRDEALHCRYGMKVQENHIDFYLQRGKEEVAALTEAGERLGISRFVGLYQQFGK